VATKRFSVGDVVRLANGIGLCEIVKILPACTVEVRACNGGRVFRVSGLNREHFGGAYVHSFEAVQTVQGGGR
jgi:hypothetical protein